MDQRSHGDAIHLDQVIEVVTSSAATDWNVIQAIGADPCCIHELAAVLRPDVRIALKWGHTCVENFSEPWTERFPHWARSFFADTLYAGTVVARDVLVDVDGGACILPLARSTDLLNPAQARFEVTVREEALARLLDGLARIAVSRCLTFDDYMRKSGIERVT